MNTILNVGQRTTVIFDPSDQDHRYYAHQFLKNMSWRNCPYRFALPENHDVFHMISKYLTQWYLQQEFDTGRQESTVVKLHG